MVVLRVGQAESSPASILPSSSSFVAALANRVRWMWESQGSPTEAVPEPGVSNRSHPRGRQGERGRPI